MTKKEIINELFIVAELEKELKAEYRSRLLTEAREGLMKSRKEWLEQAYDVAKKEGKHGAKIAIYIASGIMAIDDEMVKPYGKSN